MDCSTTDNSTNGFCFIQGSSEPQPCAPEPTVAPHVFTTADAYTNRTALGQEGFLCALPPDGTTNAELCEAGLDCLPLTNTVRHGESQREGQGWVRDRQQPQQAVSSRSSQPAAQLWPAPGC